MRTSTGLECDSSRRRFLEEFHHLSTRQLLAKDWLLECVHAMQLETLFDVSMPIRIISSTDGLPRLSFQRTHPGTLRCRWEPSTPTRHEWASISLLGQPLAMRSRVCVSQASGSTLFIFAVCSSVARVAQFLPPPSLSTKSEFLWRARRCWSRARCGPRSGSAQRWPHARWRSGCLGELRFAGDPRQGLMPEGEELGDDHRRGLLTHRDTGLRACPAHGLLDLPELPHPRSQEFFVGWHRREAE